MAAASAGSSPSATTITLRTVEERSSVLRDVLQLSKSDKRAIGRVDRAPSHAATWTSLFRILCMASYPWIVRRAAWNSRKPCLAFTRRLIA